MPIQYSLNLHPPDDKISECVRVKRVLPSTDMGAAPLTFWTLSPTHWSSVPSRSSTLCNEPLPSLRQSRRLPPPSPLHPPPSTRPCIAHPANLHRSSSQRYGPASSKLKLRNCESHIQYIWKAIKFNFRTDFLYWSNLSSIILFSNMCFCNQFYEV